jgi:hypothetical protein
VNYNCIAQMKLCMDIPARGHRHTTWEEGVELAEARTTWRGGGYRGRG